jgi:hypothetical protein
MPNVTTAPIVWDALSFKRWTVALAVGCVAGCSSGKPDCVLGLLMLLDGEQRRQPTKVNW